MNRLVGEPLGLDRPLLGRHVLVRTDDISISESVW